jgi:hypothetical protein
MYVLATKAHPEEASTTSASSVVVKLYTEPVATYLKASTDALSKNIDTTISLVLFQAKLHQSDTLTEEAVAVRAADPDHSI